MRCVRASTSAHMTCVCRVHMHAHTCQSVRLNAGMHACVCVHRNACRGTCLSCVWRSFWSVLTYGCWQQARILQALLWASQVYMPVFLGTSVPLNRGVVHQWVNPVSEVLSGMHEHVCMCARASLICMHSSLCTCDCHVCLYLCACLAGPCAHVCVHTWGLRSSRGACLPTHLLWKWLMSCTFRKMTAFWEATATGTWGQRSRCCMWWLCRNCSLPTKACSELSSSWMMELGGDGVRRDPGAPEGGGRPPPPMQPTAAHLQNKPGNVGSTPKATWRPQSRSCPCLPDPHLSLVLYSSSDTASPGNSGASVGPHSGDSW